MNGVEVFSCWPQVEGVETLVKLFPGLSTKGVEINLTSLFLSCLLFSFSITSFLPFFHPSFLILNLPYPSLLPPFLILSLIYIHKWRHATSALIRLKFVLQYRTDFEVPWHKEINGKVHTKHRATVHRHEFATV